MISDRTTYRTIVTFGKEHSGSITEPQRFRGIVGELDEILAIGRVPLNVRGLIEDNRGKNVAPRGGAYAANTLSRWLDAIQQGRFDQLEIFGPAWSGTESPLVYGSIKKLWDYGPTGYLERTRHGAENTLTVALSTRIPNIEQEWVEDRMRRLLSLTHGFYGFIEQSIEWDVPTDHGTRGYLMDMRWHDIANNAYRNGKYQMDMFVPGVYWGNGLLAAHVRGGIPSLPRDLTNRIEQWEGGVTYVRFNGDPQRDQELRSRLSEFLSVVPRT